MTEQPLVLLVDDDGYVRHVLRQQLQASGYRVQEVECGERAIGVIRGLRPDLVILDVMMEGMNGLEVCAQLKADPDLADTPVLFLSSADDLPTRAAGFELGGQDFMKKPVDVRELRMRVKVAMVTKVQRDSLKAAAKRLESEIQRLQFEALVDPLTGLTNRRGFMTDGNRTLREARGADQPVSLWLLDVDYFKRVNDTWGHVVGDEMLKRVAGQLRDDLGAQHICARIGGEEFAVIQSGVFPQVAAILAERARESIAGLAYQVGDDLVRVTVSIGTSSYPEDGLTLEALLAASDQRLYAAKQAGRNRVLCSDVVCMPLRSTH